MYCLEVLKSDKFQSPPVIRDNFNRDCSACFSRGGVVCHSAALRSTFFCDATRHAESFHLIQCATSCNQTAVNAAIEALAADYSVAAAWRAMLAAVFADKLPGVKIHGGERVKHAAVPIRADVPNGRLTERVNAANFPALFFELARLSEKRERRARP